MMKIKGREATKDVQVMHKIQFASINLMITDTDWQGLTKLQSVAVMIQWLKLLSPALGIDLESTSYCLPKTNNTNSAGKVVLDAKTVKIIAEGAKKYLPFYQTNCKELKDVNAYIGRALSQLNRVKYGEEKASSDDWDSEGDSDGDSEGDSEGDDLQ